MLYIFYGIQKLKPLKKKPSWMFTFGMHMNVIYYFWTGELNVPANFEIRPDKIMIKLAEIPRVEYCCPRYF